MNVELPTTGCNIINSSTTFYNYSSDGRTRTSYVIYDGKALKQAETYNQYGYSYTGDCLNTGDLLYKPELVPLFEWCCIILCALIAVLLWKTIGRLIGR